METLNQISTAVLSYVHPFGYILIFICAAIEASPVLGIILPGQIIVMVGGYLAFTGQMNLFYIIFASISGSIIGDWASFEFGKKYGKQFLKKYKGRFMKSEYFIKAKAILHENRGKTLFASRFNNVTRAIIPFTAGMIGFPKKQFLKYNMASGITWGILFPLIGFFFGQSYQYASGIISKIIFWSIILMGIIGFFLAKKYKSKACLKQTTNEVKLRDDALD